MEAYALDLRQRVCAAYDQGDCVQDVAERFEVGRWFVHKVLRQRRLEGSIAPKPRGRGPAATIGPADRARLKKLLRTKPDATLAELCRSLVAAGGVAVSVPTMCRTLKRLRLPLKKRRSTPASGRPHAYGRCVATTRSGRRRWRHGSWSWSTRAVSTPR
jgi:transposase